MSGKEIWMNFMNFDPEVQSLLTRLKSAAGNKAGYIRPVALFSAMIINVALGYVVTKINTIYLSVEQFGQFSLFINILSFIQVFFNLGLFESASRLIAIEKDRVQARKIFGSLIIASLVLGLLLNLSILTFASFADRIFSIPVAFLLIIFWPLAMSVAWQNMLQIVLRGFSYISILSIYLMSPRILYLIFLVVLISGGMFTLTGSLNAFLFSSLIAVMMCILFLKPLFTGIRTNFRRLLEESRSYGSHLYIANVMSTCFVHLDKLIIGYFLDARQLAYYTLAFTLTAPIPYFSVALSTSAFKQFAQKQRLHRNTLILNTAYLILISLFLIALHRLIIIDLFSEQFTPAIQPFIILVLAFVFSGLSTPYTMFFKAHRLGRQVRDITVSSQILFLLLSFIFIPWIGIPGAAVALLISYLLDYILCLIYYKRHFG
jgi:O-antigen/teichoic acid export membrane protein